MRVVRRERAAAGFNMTPMIDVVFLLIIFFLVSSHLAQREKRIQVALPAAESGQLDPAQHRTRVIVTLETDGRLWVGAERLALAELTARLQDLQSGHQERTSVIIRCDRHVPYGDVEPLLSAAVRAGITDVSFAVVDRAERAGSFTDADAETMVKRRG